MLAGLNQAEELRREVLTLVIHLATAYPWRHALLLLSCPSLSCTNSGVRLGGCSAATGETVKSLKTNYSHISPPRPQPYCLHWQDTGTILVSFPVFRRCFHFLLHSHDITFQVILLCIPSLSSGVLSRLPRTWCIHVSAGIVFTRSLPVYISKGIVSNLYTTCLIYIRLAQYFLPHFLYLRNYHVFETNVFKYRLTLTTIIDVLRIL